MLLRAHKCKQIYDIIDCFIFYFVFCFFFVMFFIMQKKIKWPVCMKKERLVRDCVSIYLHLPMQITEVIPDSPTRVLIQSAPRLWPAAANMKWTCASVCSNTMSCKRIHMKRRNRKPTNRYTAPTQIIPHTKMVSFVVFHRLLAFFVSCLFSVCVFVVVVFCCFFIFSKLTCWVGEYYEQ